MVKVLPLPDPVRPRGASPDPNHPPSNRGQYPNSPNHLTNRKLAGRKENKKKIGTVQRPVPGLSVGEHRHLVPGFYGNEEGRVAEPPSQTEGGGSRNTPPLLELLCIAKLKKIF